MLREIVRSIFYNIISRFPKLHADYLFKRVFGYRIDWNNPRDFNEWIRWEIINCDMSRWAPLADKYKVREYIKSKGLEHLLVRLYGVYESAFDIDFDKLPDRFILKVNHGSGDITICSNAEEKEQIRNDKKRLAYFDKLLSKSYGMYSGERHYLKIKPLIIIEELLDKNKQAIKSNSLVDYKFICIGGKPISCKVIYNRGSNPISQALYDMQWNNIGFNVQEDTHFVVSNQPIPRPKLWSDMIKYCEILSRDFPQVRVDLYEVDGKVYFGELTFANSGGLNTSYTAPYLQRLGAMLAEVHKNDLKALK